MAKQYGDAVNYEAKLSRVMERLGIKEFNYDFSRHGSWVEFRYKGQLYRFDHSVEKAQSRGINLKYGSDAFAQIVLSLEDLAMGERVGLHVYPHLIRHTLATIMLNNGASLLEVQLYLGHEDPATTLTYAKLKAQSVRAAFMKTAA